MASIKGTGTATNVNPEELFVKLEAIGKGSFGEVFKALNKQTNQLVAVKVLDLDTDDDEITDVQKEINMLSLMDSEYITRYHGSYLNRTKLWIVMDYAAGGSLRSILKSGPLEERYLAVVAREVLLALVYLHNNAKIIHRDIKAANILLTETGKVKLCDFGVAGQISLTSLRRNSFVGTPYWMAPEIITRSQYDFKADIWSLGITIIELATGNPPFADQDPRRALFLIPRSKPPKLEGNFSPAIKEFIGLCLREEPEERPNAEELLKSKFIKGAHRGTAILTELLQRHEAWKIEHPELIIEDSDSDEFDDFEANGEDGWVFDTYKPSSAQLQDNLMGNVHRFSRTPTRSRPKSRVRDSSPSNAGIQHQRPMSQRPTSIAGNAVDDFTVRRAPITGASEFQSAYDEEKGNAEASLDEGAGTVRYREYQQQEIRDQLERVPEDDHGQVDALNMSGLSLQDGTVKYLKENQAEDMTQKMEFSNGDQQFEDNRWQNEGDGAKNALLPPSPQHSPNTSGEDLPAMSQEGPASFSSQGLVARTGTSAALSQFDNSNNQHQHHRNQSTTSYLSIRSAQPPPAKPPRHLYPGHQRSDSLVSITNSPVPNAEPVIKTAAITKPLSSSASTQSKKNVSFQLEKPFITSIVTRRRYMNSLKQPGLWTGSPRSSVIDNHGGTAASSENEEGPFKSAWNEGKLDNERDPVRRYPNDASISSSSASASTSTLASTTGKDGAELLARVLDWRDVEGDDRDFVMKALSDRLMLGVDLLYVVEKMSRKWCE